MSATHSKGLSDVTAPFHLDAAPNPTVYEAEADGWDPVESRQPHRAYRGSPWLRFDSFVQAPGPILPTVGRADVIEEAGSAKPIEFAYDYEKDFAGTLDARAVSWQYKPRTFAVEWDDEGNFVDCFTPDFYLPANETYIAVISRDRHESGAKTRKVEMLRWQHPEIRIEILRTP